MMALMPFDSQIDAQQLTDQELPAKNARAGDSLVLDPLADLLDSAPPGVEELETAGAERIPEPYRQLLVHARDMTSTLELHHGEPSRLEVLTRRRGAGALLRKVLLRGINSGRVQEFGAIRIELDRFGPEARQAILDGRQPLGSILSSFKVEFTSRPQRFFAIEAAGELRSRLGTPLGGRFYGRRNLLIGSEGTLAEVVEILPPAVL